VGSRRTSQAPTGCAGSDSYFYRFVFSSHKSRLPNCRSSHVSLQTQDLGQTEKRIFMWKTKESYLLALTSCSLVERYQCFNVTSFIHLQGRKVSSQEEQYEELQCCKRSNKKLSNKGSTESMWEPTHFRFALAVWMEEELDRERTMQECHMNLKRHIINLCLFPVTSVFEGDG